MSVAVSLPDHTFCLFCHFFCIDVCFIDCTIVSTLHIYELVAMLPCRRLGTVWPVALVTTGLSVPGAGLLLPLQCMVKCSTIHETLLQVLVHPNTQ